MDDRHNQHAKGYTKGIFWPSAILPVVVLGDDNLFRLEHSGAVLTCCNGKDSSNWNWNGAQVARFESDKPITGKGGFIMGMDHKRLSQLSGALAAIQQPGIARELLQLFPLIDLKVRAYAGTKPDLERHKTKVFAKLMKACLTGAAAPCPHRRAIAWHTMEMDNREGGQFAWAALYHFCELKEQPLIAQRFITSTQISRAFAAGAKSWTEPRRTPEEEAQLLMEGTAELNALWPEAIQTFEATSPSPAT